MKNSSAYALPGGSNLSSPATSSARITIRPLPQTRVLPIIDAGAKFLAALGTGGFVGWLSAWGVSIGIDTAYMMIERAQGHSIAHHGVFMAMAMWFFFVPFTSAFTFGSLR